MHERQVELEKESLELGKERYWKEIERQGHEESTPARRLITASVKPLTAAIVEYVSDSQSGKAGRRFAAVKHLSRAKPEALALLTLRAILHGISRRVPVMQSAHLIGSLVKEHLEWSEMNKEHPGLVKHVGRSLDKSTSQRHRRAVVRHVVQSHGAPLEWGNRTIEQAGMALIDLAIASTGLVQMSRQSEGRHRTTNYLVATDDVIAMLHAAHARCELLHPLYYPMVCRPKEWSNPFNGGYLTRRMPVVKKAQAAYLEELRHIHMPQVYRALNALQDTRWRINKAVYAVLQRAWDEGLELGGALPPRDDLPLPSKPADIDTNEQAKRDWKHKAAKVYAENAGLMGKRIGVARRLSIAQKFAEEAELYFPHALDWRGRAYPIPTDVTPQGDDLGRALLQFAEGKTLGENGAYWLAVHVANCFGIDKVGFDERVAWVQEHTPQILDSALRPIDGEVFWIMADKPWQALAACMEWAGYTMQGDEYVSHLPIAVDGSCNGLQNFSAMLRDQVGGAATNLVPSDQPQDIYARVAQAVDARVRSDAMEGDALAALWVGKVDRSLVKRPVMTLPYGVTRYGMREQVLAEVRKTKVVEDAHAYEASIYISNVIYEAIGSVVVAARQAMDWLQHAAEVVSRNGLPVRWTSPVGFPVLQAYRTYSTKRMKVFVGGRKVYFNFREDGFTIDAKRQMLGISPNFVHSCDASHMMLTVGQSLDAGIASFAMIHDSYATLACDVDTLAAVLRAAFVQQYSDNVLGRFRDELLEQLPPELAAEIEPLPPTGSLDIRAVMDSPYFFA